MKPVAERVVEIVSLVEQSKEQEKAVPDQRTQVESSFLRGDLGYRLDPNDDTLDCFASALD